MNTNNNESIPAEIKIIAKAADDKKAANIVILAVEQVTSLASYFIFCNGESSRQNASIVGEIKDQLTKVKRKPLHIEGGLNSSWTLMDYGDYIVHVFLPDTREFYNLEGLWADAERVDLEQTLNKSEN